MINPMVVGFCYIVGLWYSDWWVWDLRIFAQFQGSEMSPGLFQDSMNEYARLSKLAVENSAVVMTSGSQSRRTQTESYG